MTDMDEIRGLVGDYGAAEFRAGRFVESGSTTRSAACRDADDKRSALLQRVEALREERDGWQRAAQTAGQYREMERARAEAAESALAALRAAPRGCTACGSGFRNVEVGFVRHDSDRSADLTCIHGRAPFAAPTPPENKEDPTP